MNLDLTAATEAAKTAAFLCGVREQRDEFIIAAAAPLIAAQVGEQIAAAIEAERDGMLPIKEGYEHIRDLTNATFSTAARIAREVVR